MMMWKAGVFLAPFLILGVLPSSVWMAPTVTDTDTSDDVSDLSDLSDHVDTSSHETVVSNIVAAAQAKAVQTVQAVAPAVIVPVVQPVAPMHPDCMAIKNRCSLKYKNFEAVCASNGQLYEDHCRFLHAKCLDPTLTVSEKKCMRIPLSPNVAPKPVNNCNVDCYKDDRVKGIFESVCASNGVIYPSRCLFNNAKCKDTTLVENTGGCTKYSSIEFVHVRSFSP